MATKYIPDGVHTITPYLVARDAAALLDFIRRGLDEVTTIHEMKGADGTTWHADLKIGDSHLMLGQACKPKDAMQSMLWWFATHVEDVSAEELERRAKLARG